jgi:hypothetical protein
MIGRGTSMSIHAQQVDDVAGGELAVTFTSVDCFVVQNVLVSDCFMVERWELRYLGQ